MLFKILFKGILVKIYYEIFRWKKSDHQNKNSGQLIKKNLAYFSIIVLAIILTIGNTKNKNQVKAATENRISKTIMANIVENQFGVLAGDAEELVEDSYRPGNSEIISEEKYYSDSIAAIQKNTGLANEQSETSQEPVLVNEDALAVKPKNINPQQEVSTIQTITRKRSEIIDYTVQSGDTISSIANKFGITINTVLWANDLASYSIIRPGDKLTILPQSGVLHTVQSGDTISAIARSYGVESGDITNNNNYGSVLNIGEKLMIPGGSKARTVAAATTQPVKSTGISIIKDLVKPEPAPVANTSVTNEKMAWPTQGKRITQYYSWRHTGLDIGNKTGTPLYASEAGTVEYSGWSNGYGYNVLINHGGGKKTRYAHASKLYVSVGDSVARGEAIAAMGSTGWSTGPHIHFEVIINGKKYNPLNYIK